MLIVKEWSMIIGHTGTVVHFFREVPGLRRFTINITERSSVTIDFEWMALIYEQSILFSLEFLLSVDTYITVF